MILVLQELLCHLLQPVMIIEPYLLEQGLETEKSDLLTVPSLTGLTMETDVETPWTSITRAVTLDVLRHYRIELSLLPCVENRYTHHRHRHHYPFSRSLLVMPTLIDDILVIDGITLKIDNVHSTVLKMTTILELIEARRP